MAILTGAGTAFSTGADLAAVDTLGPEDQYDPDFVYSGPGYLGFTRLTDVFKPTIAAAWCNIRIASSNAEFGLLERRWNVPLVDGGTQRLPRILGWGRAMDLMLTGRRIDARDAYDWVLSPKSPNRINYRTGRLLWPDRLPPIRKVRSGQTSRRHYEAGVCPLRKVCASKTNSACRTSAVRKREKDSTDFGSASGRIPAAPERPCRPR